MLKFIPLSLTFAIVTLSAIVPSQGHAQTKKQPPQKTGTARWEKAIAAFEALDRKNPPPKNAILFAGSSSIRRWNLEKYFPKLKTINRGFGGSEMADVVHFAPRIIFKHKPRIVVVYEGDNDLGRGKTPEQIVKGFQELVRIIHAVLPGTTIIFIAVKPSLRRWNLAGIQRKTNGMIEQICKKDKRLIYLDVFTPMLGKDGTPRKELFVKDGLHMTDAGYRIWAKALRPHLLPADSVGGKDAAKTVQQKVQGTWKVTAVTYNGKDFYKGGQAPLDFVVKDNEIVVKGNDAVKKEYARLRFKLDSSVKPAIFDITVTSGVQKNVKMEGIYELKGDNMKLCVRIFGVDRPESFAAPAGSNNAYLVLKRQRP